MSHDEWLECADLYALGALDGEELGRFEDHIDAGCEECERQVHEAREALLLIPRSLPRCAGPSPDVKRRLDGRVAREATDPPRQRRAPSPAVAWAGPAWGSPRASLLLVGLAGLAAWDDWNLRGQLRDLDAEAIQLRS